MRLYPFSADDDTQLDPTYPIELIAWAIHTVIPHWVEEATWAPVGACLHLLGYSESERRTMSVYAVRAIFLVCQKRLRLMIGGTVDLENGEIIPCDDVWPANVSVSV